MPQRSWAQLERETGLDQLPRRLAQAQRHHYIPLDALVAIHRATGISVAELLVAFFEDSGYGDLLPYNLTSETLGTLQKILEAAPPEQRLLAAWLDWLRYNAERPDPE